MKTRDSYPKRAWRTTLGEGVVLLLLVPLIGCGGDAPGNPNYWTDAGTDGKAGSDSGTSGSGGSDQGSGGSGGASDGGTGGGIAGTGGGIAGSGGDTAGSGGDSAGTGGDSAGSGGDSAGAGAGAPSGFYVWWRKVTEDGSGSYTVDQEITEEDMEWKVGPTGWSGCPEGVSCTHYGINMVGFEPASGRYHFQRAVTTGSDYQKYGVYTFDEGAVEVTFEQSYSCAHPTGGPYDTTETQSFTANVDDAGLLWLQGFDGAGAGQYWIYRPVTNYDAHHRYWWYYCGGPAETCHCLCSSTDFLADWDCYL